MKVKGDFRPEHLYYTIVLIQCQGRSKVLQTQYPCALTPTLTNKRAPTLAYCSRVSNNFAQHFFGMVNVSGVNGYGGWI